MITNNTAPNVKNSYLNLNALNKMSSVNKFPYLSADRVSFGSSKIEEIEVTKDFLETLPEMTTLPCPCCGKTMIPRKTYNDMRNSEVFDKSSKEVLDAIEPFKESMHRTDVYVFNELKRLNKENPKLNLDELINELAEPITTSMKANQNKVLRTLRDSYTMRLDSDGSVRFYQFIDKMKEKVEKLDIRNAVKMMSDEIDKIVPPDKNEDLNRAMKKTTQKFPEGYARWEDRAILNFTNCKHREIGRYMIQHSTATLDHIRPRSIDKDKKLNDIPSNWILMCQKDNKLKDNVQLYNFVDKFKHLPVNMQKYFDSLIDLANENKIPASYVEDLAQRVAVESNDKIKINTDRLKIEAPKKTEPETGNNQTNSKKNLWQNMKQVFKIVIDATISILKKISEKLSDKKVD